MLACSNIVGGPYEPADNFFFIFFIFLQERLQYIAEFSKKPHHSTMLAADTNQTATNIAEQMFSIYRYDLSLN